MTTCLHSILTWLEEFEAYEDTVREIVDSTLRVRRVPKVLNISEATELMQNERKFHRTLVSASTEEGT